jgi:hypothetical protein
MSPNLANSLYSLLQNAGYAHLIRRSGADRHKKEPVEKLLTIAI